MREIKFRAWQTETKKMLDLKKITPLALDNPHMNGLFIPFDDNIVLMQYTGYKDIHNKDIYHKDIVRVTTKVRGETIVYNTTIEWSNGWVLAENKTKFVAHAAVRLRYALEVIGNVHQNPELLS